MEIVQPVEKALFNCLISCLDKNVPLWHRDIEVYGVATYVCIRDIYGTNDVHTACYSVYNVHVTYWQRVEIQVD